VKNQLGNQQHAQVSAIRSFDKRTGKRLYDNEWDNNQGRNNYFFNSLNIDPRRGEIQLLSYNLKIIHYMDTDGKGAVPKAELFHDSSPAPRPRGGLVIRQALPAQALPAQALPPPPQAKK
jgi:hypothetical protein